MGKEKSQKTFLRTDFPVLLYIWDGPLALSLKCVLISSKKNKKEGPASGTSLHLRLEIQQLMREVCGRVKISECSVGLLYAH